MCASPTTNYGCSSSQKAYQAARKEAGTAPGALGIIPTDDNQLTIAALHQGNYATISNYLERELRYMDAGERGPKAPKLGHRGRRVTNSHVIHYDFGHRYAHTALGGADLR